MRKAAAGIRSAAFSFTCPSVAGFVPVLSMAGSILPLAEIHDIMLLGASGASPLWTVQAGSELSGKG